MSSSMIFIYVSARSIEEAKSISQVLLEKKLAACTNIFPGMHSMYCWEGKIEQAQEVALLIKTQKNLYLAIQEEIQKIHSYSVPCIIEISLGEINKAYQDWLESCLQSNTHSPGKG